MFNLKTPDYWTGDLRQLITQNFSGKINTRELFISLILSGLREQLHLLMLH